MKMILTPTKVGDLKAGDMILHPSDWKYGVDGKAGHLVAQPVDIIVENAVEGEATQVFVNRITIEA
jgi:hypothetical protein